MPAAPVRLLRWGPWFLVFMGIALVGAALIAHSGEGSLCLGLVGIGVICVMAGVVLPRAAGRVSLGSDGVKADLVDVRELERSVAASVTEIAEKTIPDDRDDKAAMVQTLRAHAVQTWAAPGQLAGTWWAVLSAHHREPEKIDVVDVKQHGDDVVATIGRVCPTAQDERRWQFVGKVRGGFLFGMFFTTTPDIGALSYGTIQLRRVDPDGTSWDGFYVRLKIRADREGWSELEPITLRWQRDRPVVV